MPWITNNDSSKEYKVSIYAKEELPTWDEVYNEWYKNKQFVYDPDGELGKIQDLYWKIPHQIYLLSTVCNQLNKTIHEDGLKDQVLKYLEGIQSINQNFWYDFLDIRFGLSYDPYGFTAHETNIYPEYLKERCKLGTSEPPLIYSIKMPNGHINPFIVNDLPREFIEQNMDFYKKIGIEIYLMCYHKSGNFTGPMLRFSPFGDEENRNKYESIIDYLMTPYKIYFENGVGWKDEDGRLKISDRTVIMGYDSAK